jgi:hypothetical protein
MSSPKGAVRSALVLGLLAFSPPALWADSVSSTFIGGFGGVVSSSGATSVSSSGAQIGGAVMSASGLNILESGFLRFFAVLTAGIPGNSTYVVNYTLAASQVALSLPANACPSNAAVTLQSPTAVPSDGGSIHLVPGTAVQVLSCPDSTIPVELSYSNMNLAGFDASRLKIAVYNDASGAWVPLDSQLDGTGQTLRASVNHLSTFAVVQSDPATSLSSVVVYPNPYRAARGDIGVTFINLPAEASVGIYTLRGEEVKALTANDSGEAFWDVTNRSGAPVASGVYFALLRGGGKTQTIKIGVRR